MTDHYEALGVSAHASDAVIRAAYRARIRQTHPDAGGSAGEAQRVNEAYAVLSDPDQRAQYDHARTCSPAPSSSAAVPPARPEPAPLPIRPWWRRWPAFIAVTVWMLSAAATALLVGVWTTLWLETWICVAAGAAALWALSTSRWRVAAPAALVLAALSLTVTGFFPMTVLLGVSIVAGLTVRACIEAEVDDLVIERVDVFWRTVERDPNADVWFAEDVAHEGSRTRVLLQQLDGQQRTTRVLWGEIAQGTYLLLTDDDEPRMTVPYEVMERSSRHRKGRA